MKKAKGSQQTLVTEHPPLDPAKIPAGTIHVVLLLVLKRRDQEYHLTRDVFLRSPPTIGDGIDVPHAEDSFMLLVDGRFFTSDGTLWVYDDQTKPDHAPAVEEFITAGWRLTKSPKFTRPGKKRTPRLK